MSFNEFTSNKRKVDLSGSKDRTDRKQILDKAAQQRAQRQAEKDRLHAAIVIQVGSCSVFYGMLGCFAFRSHAVVCNL